MAEVSASAAPTDKGARWLLIALLFAGTALNYVDRQVLALLKPTLEAEFGWSDTDFAHLGSVFQLSAAGALLFVGWFVDKFGVRFAYGLAVAVWSLAGICHAAARTVSQFVIARAVLAVAESVNTPAAVKAAATYLPLKERSLGLGLVNTAPNIGAILTPLLIPPLALAFGWQSAFIITGALGFIWLGFWIAGTRRLKPLIAVVPGKPVATIKWSELLSDRRSWAVIGAKALTDCVWWFLLFWTPDLFARVFRMSQAELGGPIALIYTMAALGALSSGLLFPRLIERGMSVNAARKSSMLFYAVLILPISLALTASSPWTAALLIGLALFAHQGFSTNIFGMTADIVPAARVGSVMAAGAVAGNLTGLGIIELTGWSLTNGIGYWPMFAIASGAYLAALALIQLILPRLVAEQE
ncbi:MFS transporter [Polymorphobacter multimanifer]|uniref:ACS family hexuronate transporter-like MFS transporter n=1 Tax=Polymorphobacter multimanifer TaxID=1070431 RepID=A0A841LI99_9SPHN|nr:MFS transporter [Polymorphobacter multimanifer]MBB6228698.1 ACS family hexuronate transporter-like MFS transporter [Polymorphobacter multimanifer]GGI87022.1 MFS transporter [Polymorphobacter multimanifer]